VRRNFLHPPSSVLEYVADAVRVLGVASVLVLAIWGTATDAGVLAFTLPALLLPRFLGARAGFDVAFGVTVLIAAWSNVLDVYTTLPWWDLLVHFLCTGVIVVAAYLTLAQAAVVADPRRPGSLARTPLVLASALGLAVSALWEMVEWFGYTFITDDIFVAYADTIGDMAVGGLGGVCAGIVLAFVRLRRPDADDHESAAAAGSVQPAWQPR